MQTNCANHDGYSNTGRRGSRYFVNDRNRKVCVNGCGEVTDNTKNNSDLRDTGSYTTSRLFLLSDGKCDTVCPTGQTFYHTMDYAGEMRCTTGCTTDSTQKYTKVHTLGSNTVSTPVQCLSVCETGQAYDKDSFYCTVTCSKTATNKYRLFGGLAVTDRDQCVDVCPSGRYYDDGTEFRCTPQCPPLDFAGNLVSGKQDQLYLHAGTCKDSCTYNTDATVAATYTYPLTFNSATKTYCTTTCPPTNITLINGGFARASGKEGFNDLDANLFLKNLANNVCVSDCASGEVFVPSNKTFGLVSTKYDPAFFTTDRCLLTCPIIPDTGKLAPSSKVAKITTGSDKVLLRDHCSASCQGSGYKYTNPNLGGADTTVEQCTDSCSASPITRNFIYQTNTITEKHFCQVACPTGSLNRITNNHGDTQCIADC
jgi:hypothetical protein